VSESTGEVQRFNSPRGWTLVWFLLGIAALTLWGSLISPRFGLYPLSGLFWGPLAGLSLASQAREVTLVDRELTRRSWMDALLRRRGVTYHLEGAVERTKNGDCMYTPTRTWLGRLPSGALYAIRREGLEVRGELPPEPRPAGLARISCVFLWVVAAIVSVIAPDWWLALIPVGISLAVLAWDVRGRG
jgi:hypothetical protein